MSNKHAKNKKNKKSDDEPLLFNFDDDELNKSNIPEEPSQSSEEREFPMPDMDELNRLFGETEVPPSPYTYQPALYDEDLKDDTEDEDSSTDDSIPSSGCIEQNVYTTVDVQIIPPLANPREELNRLVGCADIKQRMDELVALSTYNKLMQDRFPGCKQHNISLHSIFLGRPGTGKTTVAKIYGSLLRQAGVLSKGHVVVCDRGTFIGTLWGDEERSMNQVLDLAKGGVLLFDEAYLLSSGHQNDPGKIILQQLMKILADESQRDFAVVLCGYKEPMEKLIASNPGLYSRFPNRFEFQDFSVNDLLEITKQRVSEYGYQFTDRAWEKYCHFLEQAYAVRDPQTWGNARYVANFLERIYLQHAKRCIQHQLADKDQFRLLVMEDIVPLEVAKQKPKIGF